MLKRGTYCEYECGKLSALWENIRERLRRAWSELREGAVASIREMF
jgi:hypothetical protein